MVFANLKFGNPGASIAIGSQTKTMVTAMEIFEMNSKMRKLACEGQRRNIGRCSTTYVPLVILVYWLPLKMIRAACGLCRTN
jgi:hypothetical protein